MERKMYLSILILILFSLLVLAPAQPTLNATPLAEGQATALNSYNKIFLGWIDLDADAWALHEYTTKGDWSAAIDQLNNVFQTSCKTKYLSDKTITCAARPNDPAYNTNELYIRFYDVRIDYNKYNLYLAIDFIDVKAQKILFTLPQNKYYGSAWGFENFLGAALEKVNKQIQSTIRKQSVVIDNTLPDFKATAENTPAIQKSGPFANYKNIIIGWVDMHPENFALYKYSSKNDWAKAISRLNNAFHFLCGYEIKGWEITGALSDTDKSFPDEGLFIRFSDVRVDYNDYIVYLTIEFVDLKSEQVLYKIPNTGYKGKIWGFENFVTLSLKQVAAAIEDGLLKPAK